MIRIEGELLPTRCRTDTVGYLGAVGCVAMTGDAQLMATRRRCGWYAHAITRHHMRPDRALLLVNKHLIPAISYSIRSLCCKRADVCALDKMVAMAVSCGGAGSVRAVAPAVLACITGVLLPSVEEAVIKIGETFLRLNGARPALARHCWLDIDKPRSRVPRATSMARAITLAKQIGWRFELVCPRTRLKRPIDDRRPEDAHRSSDRVWCPVVGD